MSAPLKPEDFEVEASPEATEEISYYVKCPICMESEDVSPWPPKITDFIRAAAKHIEEKHS
ncbi:hypothetical protein ACIOHC_35675 [Streptomyces sp. NPDC088252]|uniref:hypothetical protein n=1 Tax=Streptomyces sp. NPDC088252 TaxID=3365845 RepID=UPI003829D4E0